MRVIYFASGMIGAASALNFVDIEPSASYDMPMYLPMSLGQTSNNDLLTASNYMHSFA